MALMTKGIGRPQFTPKETFVLVVGGYLEDPSRPGEFLVIGKRQDTGAEVKAGLTPPGEKDGQRKSITDFARPGRFNVQAGGLMRIDRAQVHGDVYRAPYVKMLRRGPNDTEMFSKTCLAQPRVFPDKQMVNGVPVEKQNGAVFTMMHEPAARATNVNDLFAQIITLSQVENAEKLARFAGVSPVVYVREAGTPTLFTFNIGYEVHDQATGQYRLPTPEEIAQRLQSGRAGEEWQTIVSNSNNGYFGDPQNPGELEVVTGVKISIGADTVQSPGFSRVASHYYLQQKGATYQTYRAFCDACGEPAVSRKLAFQPSVVGLHVRDGNDGSKRVFVSSLQPMGQFPRMINGTKLDPAVMGIELAEDQTAANDMQPHQQAPQAQASAAHQPHSQTAAVAAQAAQPIPMTSQPASSPHQVSGYQQASTVPMQMSAGPVASGPAASGHAPAMPAHQPAQPAQTYTAVPASAASEAMDLPAGTGAQLEALVAQAPQNPATPGQEQPTEQLSDLVDEAFAYQHQ